MTCQTQYWLKVMKQLTGGYSRLGYESAKDKNNALRLWNR